MYPYHGGHRGYHMQDMQTFTYAELAQHFGITEGSCRNLVRRKRWRRTLGNDGAARILVPQDALGRPKLLKVQDVPPDGPMDASNDGGHVVPHIIQATEPLVEGLRQEISVLQASLAKAEALASERADTVERERARADSLQAEMQRVLERLLELQERQSRPWWRRFVG